MCYSNLLQFWNMFKKEPGLFCINVKLNLSGALNLFLIFCAQFLHHLAQSSEHIAACIILEEKRKTTCCEANTLSLPLLFPWASTHKLVNTSFRITELCFFACCVFWPAFGCWAHSKAGQNTFFQEKRLKTSEKKIILTIVKILSIYTMLSCTHL